MARKKKTPKNPKRINMFLRRYRSSETCSEIRSTEFLQEVFKNILCSGYQYILFKAYMIFNLSEQNPYNLPRKYIQKHAKRAPAALRVAYYILICSHLHEEAHHEVF